MILKSIADKGFHLFNRRTLTHTFKQKIYQEDFVDYAAFDNSFVDYLFPQATHGAYYPWNEGQRGTGVRYAI